MLYQLAQRGLKFGILPEFKDYGTHIGTGSGCIALMNRAPQPNAAVVFLNWFLSRDGQTTWSKALDLQSRRVDVPWIISRRICGSNPASNTGSVTMKKTLSDLRQEEAVIKELFGR